MAEVDIGDDRDVEVSQCVNHGLMLGQVRLIRCRSSPDKNRVGVGEPSSKLHAMQPTADVVRRGFSGFDVHH